MTAPILPLADAQARSLAAQAVRDEQIIAFPTDTIYGVGGNALSERAALRVFQAKGRPAGKGMPVLLDSLLDVSRVAREWPSAAALLAERFWPGALTIVLPAAASVPALVRTGDTVAVRVPGLADLRALIREAGWPLIGTSANRSGEPAAATAQEARAALGDAVALVLDGGRGEGAPSTVVEVGERSVRVVRRGAVELAALRDALRGSAVSLEVG